MVDPFSVTGMFVATLQFALQLKSYLLERKKRKRQEQQEEQQQQPLYPQTLMTGPIIYSICYNVYQAYPNYNVHYMHPPPSYLASPPLQQQPPNLYYHHNQTSYYSRSPAPASHDGPWVLPNSSSLHSETSLMNYPSMSHGPAFYDWLGLLDGHMELLHYQEAPHNTHEPLGMRTGACAYNDRSLSYNHWKSLQEIERGQGFTHVQQKTIAVVDWSRGNIDMFMEIGGAYFRNYRIRGCDVAAFAYVCKEREVFSGEIRGGKLEKFNKEMKMVENVSGARSTNSWMRLGICTEESEEMQEVLREEGSFVQTVRGAVFGLVCCLYEAPSHLNVDMETAAHLDIVRVNSHPTCQLPKRHSCLFSVFSFGDHGWAAQDILLG